LFFHLLLDISIRLPLLLLLHVPSVLIIVLEVR
jgi:hypothetical protein